MRLAVHLPLQQQIVFMGGQEAEQAAIKCTALTAFFGLNKTDNAAHSYTYSDIPHHYVFDKSGTKWKRRQRGSQQVIGRMPVVSVQDSERFCLRMLLLRCKGVVGFEDILIVDGMLCTSFQEACRRTGLLEGDEHWIQTLSEAAEAQSPNQLRMLFAIICAFGEVEDIPQL
ncbi:uncharacterized protein [Parasteatoda tepidariorum]|uniref:uncharacterized protein n=1 Tax=Parasteatoda tepidariorum TaxID=114398 RepID=UPI001C7295F4|nr:uncharacterized protein LOC122271945 [Parasteatoda tepidariorum]